MEINCQEKNWRNVYVVMKKYNKNGHFINQSYIEWTQNPPFYNLIELSSSDIKEIYNKTCPLNFERTEIQ